MMFVRRSAEPAYAGDAADKIVGSNEGRPNINKHVATYFLSQTSTIANCPWYYGIRSFQNYGGS